MQNCSYCGRENDDSAVSCSQCGTSLTEPPLHVPLVTPHRMMGHIQQSIWEHFAIKRRQMYGAGGLIGLFGGLVGSMKHSEHGFVLWALPLGAALGVGAVWLLSLMERLKARIYAKGNPTVAQQALFVIIAFVAVIFVALLIASIGLLI